jgi:hypothetical protein
MDKQYKTKRQLLHFFLINSYIHYLIKEKVEGVGEDEGEVSSLPIHLHPHPPTTTLTHLQPPSPTHTLTHTLTVFVTMSYEQKVVRVYDLFLRLVEL